MRDYILGQVTPPKWVTSRPLGFPQPPPPPPPPPPLGFPPPPPPPPSPPCKKAVWCHDGNGNGKENVVKAKGWIGETTTLHLLFNTFLFIFCRHSTPTATWECLVLRLIEDLNKRLRFFFLFLNVDLFWGSQFLERLLQLLLAFGKARELEWSRSLKVREFTFKGRFLFFIALSCL